MNNENIKKVLSHLKNKKVMSIICLLLIVLLGSIYLYNNHVKIENLKADLLKTQEKLPSEDEKKLIEYKNKVKESQEKFLEAEKRKIEAENEMKKYKTFEDCFRNQIDRVVDGKESLLEYCEQKFENQSGVVEEKKEVGFDLDKFARAVAQHETGNCSKGTGIKYNNCFGIKNGSIAPCEKRSSSGFCIYENTQDSFEAFKKIWSQAYGELPTLAMAKRWSGNDRAEAWRNNVLHFYNS